MVLLRAMQIRVRILCVLIYNRKQAIRIKNLLGEYSRYFPYIRFFSSVNYPNRNMFWSVSSRDESVSFLTVSLTLVFICMFVRSLKPLCMSFLSPEES